MHTEMPGLVLNISAVERETGLSKDVLRMWERRYGFPKPGRDDNGERQYTTADVGKLRTIKRLMDVGLRPGKIIALSLSELNAMADARTPARQDQAAPALERRPCWQCCAPHDTPALQHALANLLMRQGLQRFVLDTITPLNRAVGDAWMRGDLQVFEEHLYTEQLQVALRTADQHVSPAGRHAQDAAHHLSGRASRAGPADGRGDDGCRKAWSAFRWDRKRRWRIFGAPQIAHKAHIVALSFSRSVSGAPGHRRTCYTAPPAAPRT